MTDRLADLRSGLGNDFEDEDLEAGRGGGVGGGGTGRAEREQGRAARGDAEDPALDKFYREIDALHTAVEKIEQNAELLRENYEKPQTDGVRQKSAALIEGADKKAQAVRKRLKRIADENKAFLEQRPDAVAQGKMRVGEHQGVARAFMKAMEEFERVQEAHRDDMQDEMMQELRTINPSATTKELRQALKTGDYAHIADGADLNQAHSDVQHRLNEIRSRNNDIQQLEKSIVELHQMFVDMSVLVENQGELLNNIEYNVQQTKETAQEAEVELVQARDNQKAARRKKMCLVIIIFCIILAIVIPIVITQIK
mmetsp:Transcript_14105/g.37861  ORF Transcript_14105/g.37861 Transcript_14105/m.37861 type:complete len:312 (+) Transcript_14105:187-1122(+)